jgi:radical SAM superfamily enzyme YgiQ (UPF0313 family)
MDLVLLSLSFEGDAPHVPALLEAGGLPPLADRREAGHPWVIGGGAAVMINPEPLAPLFEALLVGEAEGLLPELLEALGRGRGLARGAQLRLLEALPGAVVPLLRRHRTWSLEGTRLRAGPEVSLRDGARAWLENPEAEAGRPVATVRAPDPGTVWAARLPPGAHFRESLLLEIARGCPRRCRFCAATRIYQPLREHPPDRIVERVAGQLTPGETVGLLALSAGDHRGLNELTARLRALGARLSIASLPAVFDRPEALAELVRCGARTLTLAPEAGSDRLRALAGKPMTNEAILASVRALGSSGVRRLKAYFLIGLPFEREDDRRAIVDLLGDMRAALPPAVALSATVNPFVPKPRTPFQWAAMAGPAELEEASRRLRAGAPRGVRIRVKSPREARIHAALTRGDATWGARLLRAALERRPLGQVLADEGTKLEHWTAAIDEEAQLPWGYLLDAAESEGLRREWRRAAEAGN